MENERSTPQDWREWRRMRAWELSVQGWTQGEIAEALGVGRPSVSQWLSAARQGGPDALRRRLRPGPTGKLLPGQRYLIADCLWHGAEAYGFRGDVWTCARVGKVIEEEFGVRYHKGHVSRILKEIGWTPQVPITRAIQRDEEAIQHWREHDWPQLKRIATRQKRTLVFVDEAGFYLLPGVVKTYGPRGRTPVVDEWQTRDHLSVMGAITTDGRVYTLVRQESLTGLETVEFLEHLGRQIKGPVLAVWDRSPIHRRANVTEFVAAVGADSLRLEPLPTYAPDLNPVEWLWRHLKKVEMRNLTCLDLEELHQEFHLALGRIRGKPRLFPSFFKGAGLSL
jgi:transposase